MSAALIKAAACKPDQALGEAVGRWDTGRSPHSYMIYIKHWASSLYTKHRSSPGTHRSHRVIPCPPAQSPYMSPECFDATNFVITHKAVSK